jgi:hypothetical protein
MRERWMMVGFFLVLLALSAVGCSLMDETSVDPGGDASGGTVIITVETEPGGQAATFQFTGVPTGTVSTDGTLVVTDLEPGTYTTTERDPAPDFDLTAVQCDDGDSPTASGGDPGSRTAVFNLDPGETVTCRFTNTRRGSLVVASETIPDGATGSFLFTGVPTGTIPASGTLVVANLSPGTYTSTERDPAPDFDVTAVQCDDGDSPTASRGDPSTRTAIFNLDPGEMVTCKFTNTRRGTVVVASETIPDGATGSFLFTGVPTGTISGSGTLVSSNLSPGTYTTTERDPAPDFDVTAVQCDDGDSPTASSGDPGSRTAVFNLDPGETVVCTFTQEAAASPDIAGGGSGSSSGEDDQGSEDAPGDATNPFDDPGRYLADFPLPDELPSDAGSYAVPKAGPWMGTNFAGQMDCGVTSLAMPAGPPEAGTLEVLDDGATVVGRGLQEDQTTAITMSANPAIIGRYTGAIGATEQGVPIIIDYFWQVVTDEYIVGYLTSSFTSQGVTCTIYRPYELTYAGQE